MRRVHFHSRMQKRIPSEHLEDSGDEWTRIDDQLHEDCCTLVASDCMDEAVPACLFCFAVFALYDLDWEQVKTCLQD